jgi:hypothetical protein
MHDAGNASAPQADDSSSERGPALQQRGRYRSRLLRLQARTDRSCAERDRASPDPRVPVPLGFAAATTASNASSAAAASSAARSELRSVLSGRMHSATAPRSQLRTFRIGTSASSGMCRTRTPIISTATTMGSGARRELLVR